MKCALAFDSGWRACLSVVLMAVLVCGLAPRMPQRRVPRGLAR